VKSGVDSTEASPLPIGFGISVDPNARWINGSTLMGGSPTRLMRLSEPGLRTWSDLTSGPIASRSAGLLARRLTDAGMAHPRPPAEAESATITVVIPVRDRPESLGRCLESLEGAYPVVVVDDGSREPRATAEVCTEFGATLIRRECSGGPGVARNTGLSAVTTELVALLDSDTVASPQTVATLAAHLADPLVALAAPRVVPVSRCTAAERYAVMAGCLDLGTTAARVTPGSRVSYVPTTALVARRSALSDLASDGAAFDPSMRIGEDVDLVWRLHDAGWRIRYDPAATVRHREPTSWQGLLRRRAQYGTSAAALARRHPSYTAPLVVQPRPMAAAVSLAVAPPSAAVAVMGASLTSTIVSMRGAGIPVSTGVRLGAASMSQSWLSLGRYCTQFAAPLLVGAALLPGGGSSRRWRVRIGAASLLLGPPLADWMRRPKALDPARFVLGRIADDVSYGAGVYAGCVRQRTLLPLRPTRRIHQQTKEVSDGEPMV
jgi:mycofactocin glycosyltransferase